MFAPFLSLLTAGTFILHSNETSESLSIDVGTTREQTMLLSELFAMRSEILQLRSRVATLEAQLAPPPSSPPSSPIPPCGEGNSTHVVFDGYLYRTLYSAPRQPGVCPSVGPGFHRQEETYAPMPPGYEVAPDGTEREGMVAAVTENYVRDRIRTQHGTLPYARLAHRPMG